MMDYYHDSQDSPKVKWSDDVRAQVVVECRSLSVYAKRCCDDSHKSSLSQGWIGPHPRTIFLDPPRESLFVVVLSLACPSRSTGIPLWVNLLRSADSQSRASGRNQVGTIPLKLLVKTEEVARFQMGYAQIKGPVAGVLNVVQSS